MSYKLPLPLLLFLILSMNQLFAQSIQTEADQQHANWQQPSEGVIIAHHADNHTRYASAGLTGEGGFKPDEKTIFEIGSITKVFTAILLAEAVRENRAGFDDAVSTHLANLTFKKHSPFHTITLSELATHTSGLPRLPIDLMNGMDKENPYAHYDERRLQTSLVSFRQKHMEKAGEYSYSNYGAGILGYVLTQIYGLPYRELLKVKILVPLGMTSTFVPDKFEELPEPIQQRIATGHHAGNAVSHWELNSLAGAGGMISTAEDLIRFGTAHWDEQTPDGLAASMVEAATPRLDDQGLGWGIDGDILSHDGGTGGFRTELQVDIKNNTVRVSLANSAGVSDQVILEGDFSPIEGYWSGVLVDDNKELRLVSYIAADGRLIVYSIDQGYLAALSATSRLTNDQFYFSIPSIPGIYKGNIVDRQLVGALNEGDQSRSSLPITMTYSNQVPVILRTRLEETMQGNVASLHGYWWGYLGGKNGLFLYMQVTSIGELVFIELYSPDQNKEGMMVTSASLNGRKFKFRIDQINGKFSGKLSKDRKRIKGFWWQGLPRPLTLHFSENNPTRE